VKNRPWIPTPLRRSDSPHKTESPCCKLVDKSGCRHIWSSSTERMREEYTCDNTNIIVAVYTLGSSEATTRIRPEIHYNPSSRQHSGPQSEERRRRQGILWVRHRKISVFVLPFMEPAQKGVFLLSHRSSRGWYAARG